MRTARSLPYEGGGLCPRESLCPRGLCPGGLCPRGSLSTRVSVRETHPRGQTDTCDIIALPQTSYAGGKYGNGNCSHFESCFILRAYSFPAIKVTKTFSFRCLVPFLPCCFTKWPCQYFLSSLLEEIFLSDVHAEARERSLALQISKGNGLLCVSKALLSYWVSSQMKMKEKHEILCIQEFSFCILLSNRFFVCRLICSDTLQEEDSLLTSS